MLELITGVILAVIAIVGRRLAARDAKAQREIAIKELEFIEKSLQLGLRQAADQVASGLHSRTFAWQQASESWYPNYRWAARAGWLGLLSFIFFTFATAVRDYSDDFSVVHAWAQSHRQGLTDLINFLPRLFAGSAAVAMVKWVVALVKWLTGRKRNAAYDRPSLPAAPQQPLDPHVPRLALP